MRGYSVLGEMLAIRAEAEAIACARVGRRGPGASDVAREVRRARWETIARMAGDRWRASEDDGLSMAELRAERARIVAAEVARACDHASDETRGAIGTEARGGTRG
jgi:hypothetical protein